MNLQQFLSELRVRKVYRSGAFYVAGTWALVQVADITFPLIGIDDRYIKILLITAAAGFPVAMVLAWVFDLTPEGIVETPSAPISQTSNKAATFKWAEAAILLVLILLVGYLYADRLFQPATNSQTESQTIASANKRESIAVIPFVNMSDEKEMDYFGDALAEEILNLLTKLDELDVTARTSSFYFKGEKADIPTIGKHLGVAHVLGGSIRHQKDNVRVSVQLVSTETGFQLWSETYTREMSNIFTLQDEIATKVVNNLDLLLSKKSKATLKDQRVVDSLAFDYYLRGRDYLRRLPSLTVLANAEQMFKNAVEIDPLYSDAHAGVCDALLERYALSHSTEDLDAAEQACQRALELDKDAVAVYVALGNLYRNSGKPEDSKQAFNTAIRLNDKSVEAYVGLAETFMSTNNYDEAEVILAKTIAMQGTYWPAQMKMANLLLATGRTEESIPYYEKINQILPESGIASNNLGAAFYFIGRFEEAAEVWLESLQHSATAAVFANLGSSYYFLRRFEEASEMYQRAIELTPNDYENWGNLADAYRFCNPAQANDTYTEAIRLAEIELSIAPQNATLMSLIGHYQANIGQQDLARDNLNKAQSISPDAMYPQYIAATAYTAMSDFDSGRIALKRALDLGYFKHLVEADAGLDGLRNHPDYQDIMKDASK